MTDQEFWAKYGQELNAKQRAAVRQITGANLLLAVPGSGKTLQYVRGKSENLPDGGACGSD